MISQNKKSSLIRDFATIILSILIAIIIARSGFIKDFLIATQGLKFLGSFLAGIFFISVFTAAPAGVILFEIAQDNSALAVALFGGLGALVGDLIIFRFIRDSIAKDILYLVKKTKFKRLIAIFRLKLFRWLIPFLGALIVASPLPDELGLSMMGLSKMKTSTFVIVSFTLNFVGILIISLIAQGFRL